MELKKSIVRLWPAMTKEEFFIVTCYNWSITQEEFEELGLEVVPCGCGLEGCCGWTLEPKKEWSGK